MKTWIGRLGCWISQGFNLFLFNGSEDETVSSRIGKYKRANNNTVLFKWEYKIVFWWLLYNILSRVPILKGHFLNAIEDDEGK